MTSIAPSQKQLMEWLDESIKDALKGSGLAIEQINLIFLRLDEKHRNKSNAVLKKAAKKAKTLGIDKFPANIAVNFNSTLKSVSMDTETINDGTKHWESGGESGEL